MRLGFFLLNVVHSQNFGTILSVAIKIIKPGPVEMTGIIHSRPSRPQPRAANYGERKFWGAAKNVGGEKRRGGATANALTR